MSLFVSELLLELRSALVFGLAISTAGALAAAEEPPTNESIAERLMASTVTVRIWPSVSPASPADAIAPPTAAQQTANAPVSASPEVTVCSGAVVGPGLVITSLYPLSLDRMVDARFRITEADGQQSKATPRVVDHYSNLCLVEVDDPRLPPLPLASETPQVGSAVMSAAAAGIERPIVSRGIVSGVDRAVAANGLPPLLQCDARASESSSGAALVDQRGRVVGIVVATTVTADRAGWTFAIPTRHVERMLAARQPGALVTLERRRPTVGFTLGPGAQPGVVVVERIAPGGPADAAGVRVGDTLVEAEGRKLRSAYQAVDLILARQPGETLQVVVERGGERRAASITLGGATGASAPSTPDGLANNGALLSNQINVRMVGRDQIEVQSGGVAELGASAAPPARPAPRDQLNMLQAQVAAFEKVIGKLQAEVRRRDQLLVETNELVKSLSGEVEQLRKRQANAPGTGEKRAEPK